MTSPRWFAKVKGTKRIDIPEIGGWIEVREELSIGAERRVFGNAVKGQVKTDDGARIEYDMSKVSFGQVVAYLTDWSARDDDDKPVELSEDAIKGLLPEVYEYIEQAVEAHAKEVKEKKPASRNASSDAPTSSAAA